MYTKLVVILLLMTTATPIWPIGENPAVGYPYLMINKQTNQLAFIDDGVIKDVYPVATGKMAELTPEGEFTVVVKARDPYYRKRNIEGGAKENPLGSRWVGFDAEDTDGRTFGIHGTNNATTIGQYVTAGCVRMKNENVEKLYEQIPVGTKVLIVNKDVSFEQLGKEHNALPEKKSEVL